jgi:hypothetical protein
VTYGLLSQTSSKTDFLSSSFADSAKPKGYEARQNMGEASGHAEEVQLSKSTGHQVYFRLKNSCTVSNLSQSCDLGVGPK